MKDVFKQLLLEFTEFDIPAGVRREVVIPELPPHVRKAITFIGMRRSGKTWVLYQNIRDLLQQGISLERIIYVNFEDERLGEIQTKDLQSLLDAYFELNPQHEKAERIFIHLDEIQTVIGWEKFVRRLLDARQFNLYITGSSAKLLSKEIATELRGRSLTREIFPLSFTEYLKHHEIEVATEKVSAKKRAVLLHYLITYLKRGGFPETLGVSDWTHREILQNYVQVVIYRDIAERHHILSVPILEKWVTHCLQNSASLLSINKVFGHFKSLGLRISKNSLYEWLDYVEDAYCLFSVTCFNLSARKASLKPKKIYPVDPGLVTAFAIYPDTKQAQTLEVAVFRSLRETSNNLYYYVTQQGWEVDFLLQTPEGQMNLFQVSLTLKNHETRVREVRALTQAMEELSLKTGLIITLEEEETITIPQGIISVVPAWKFLLSNNLTA
ncbi:MAG: hypothetical protein A3J38_10625 [Gammaproteobacteria bacterium RIFCSPHIGHO2_12_FULL_45_9]|nr:MAG: hypothetical protein A3J38_10625 [Gammaproteobacteria bacterium RIFCSPHIGHO2_12_FULL_45_9]